MPRPFKTGDYDQALETSVRLRDCLPPTHLACFVADLIAQLDLSGLYARYAPRGGVAYVPKVLLRLLFYGYATRVFSSRAIEAATYDQAPFRYLAGHTHPGHDTLAAFHSQFADCVGQRRHENPRRCPQTSRRQLRPPGCAGRPPAKRNRYPAGAEKRQMPRRCPTAW